MSATAHTEGSRSRYDIVAIVSSAGGVQSVRRVVRALPETLPAPVIIFQHLGPDHASRFAEILASDASLTVEWARPQTVLKASTVYVIPPMWRPILDPANRLHDEKACGPRTTWTWGASRLLESVATSHRERSIAVIMSGSGSDGAAGALSVKAAGGAVLVQAVETCSSPGMPLAAIDSGAADLILPPDRLATAIEVLLTIPGAAEHFIRVAETV